MVLSSTATERGVGAALMSLMERPQLGRARRPYRKPPAPWKAARADASRPRLAETIMAHAKSCGFAIVVPWRHGRFALTSVLIRRPDRGGGRDNYASGPRFFSVTVCQYRPLAAMQLVPSGSMSTTVQEAPSALANTWSSLLTASWLAQAGSARATLTPNRRASVRLLAPSARSMAARAVAREKVGLMARSLRFSRDRPRCGAGAARCQVPWI